MYRSGETDKLDWQKTGIGPVQISINADGPSTYRIWDGVKIWYDFPVQPPQDNTARIWRITRLSGGFAIGCNGIELTRHTLEKWGGYQVGRIIFWDKFEGTEWSDTASKMFRGEILYILILYILI